MPQNPVVVPLRSNRLPHHNHPDWVAFASALRSLWALEGLPVATIAESVYGFADLGNHFTAEQVLDEIGRITAALRVAVENFRASQSQL
ncbi:hypothetical protein [Fimbriiglobus ruber]|uniref:Uncharacterized protein n=1 Tax=Fimbriiglobus ruber TaxID=1908690 RepID=A0A225E066_9BACT|nr:hypothetical protein [Fimbriiglobus ruber]OWK42035.1 hypothetical protein FRUB_04113 [Fimbriiglobus ruber]